MPQYEFKLMEKFIPSGSWERLGINIVKEEDFDNQLSSFQKYIESRKKRYPNNDYMILINLLDDNGEFLEVIQ